MKEQSDRNMDIYYNDSIQVNDSGNGKKEVFDLGKLDERQMQKANKHIPSTILPDTLFTFTSELQWLIHSLEMKMISPRYCEEDLRYLNIKEMKRIAFPMKCFCDINLHKLGFHMACYGYYGLAFSKDWGMGRKVQPIQYINQDSELRKDFTVAFKSVLREDSRGESKPHSNLKNFLLHELMYYKPYQGVFVQRTTKKKCKKCFSDECEWRYIPKVSSLRMPQILTEDSLVGSVLKDYSDSLDGKPEVSLAFEYEDLKYVIVETRHDFYELCNKIDKWKLDDDEKYTLLSKIIVWENSEGDF